MPSRGLLWLWKLCKPSIEALLDTTGHRAPRQYVVLFTAPLLTVILTPSDCLVSDYHITLDVVQQTICIHWDIQNHQSSWLHVIYYRYIYISIFIFQGLQDWKFNISGQFHCMNRRRPQCRPRQCPTEPIRYEDCGHVTCVHQWQLTWPELGTAGQLSTLSGQPS